MTRAVPAGAAMAPSMWLDEGPARPRRGLRWWKEVLAAAIFYAVYSVIRNTQGSASVSRDLAFRNARRVIDLERLLGLYHERAVQHLFVSSGAIMSLWNLFYGTFHFFVTIGVLVVLFRAHPDRYRKWRNVLAATTAIALVGFAVYPLMPPRLLPSTYGFVDSLKRYGSLWSFDSTAMHKVSNQFAAMPSLHFAWSLWSACALVPALRRTWGRVVAALYPFATLCAIVITANHFVLDAVAGAAALAGGVMYATATSGALGRVRARRRAASPA
ncbi:MAG: phosphatase PAP2 family protein [Acidimicrobiales bacterium]